MQPSTGDPDGRGRTVLILDDDTAFRTTVRRVLELYGFHVLEARTAHDALVAAREHDGPIHAVLCDLVLPGLGGREAANTLLAHHPEAAVLYTSGYRSPDSFRPELEAAGAAFLGKPFEVPELLDALDRLLAA